MRDNLTSGAAWAAAAALCLSATAGCWDDGPTRVAVDGMVILDRAPLEAGSIQFHPETTDPKKALYVGATIKQGQFSLPSEEGLVPGHYKVVIYSAGYVTVPTRAAAGPPPPPGAEKTAPKTYWEPIPARYNAQTILTAEIKPGWFNTLVFPLESDNPASPRPPE